MSRAGSGAGEAAATLGSAVAAKRVAVVQSNYVPWRGYFDLINAVDEFVLLDDAQYTRRDWRNRNRIKTPQGLTWLTIPVQAKGRYLQRIDETLVESGAWAAKHLRTVLQSYARAAHIETVRPLLEDLYGRAAELAALTAVNELFLRAVCEELGITTPITRSTDYDATGEKGERILSLCLATGATTYLSGPAARSYLDEASFAAHGIAVEWMDYGGAAEYVQLHGPFEPGVSVLDLLLNCGPDARAHLKPAPGAA